MTGLRLLAGLLLAAAPLLASAQGRVLVISGIGGEERYSQQFRAWSEAMLDAARDRLGLAPERVRWLCEDPQPSAGRCAARATREAVLAALESLPVAPGDPVLVLLIGHGSARDGRALFNLPGPDLAAEDLAAALERFSDTPLAVVDTTPSSAPFMSALARTGRVVITATAHAGEDDHTRFAGHFVAAYGGSAADADKDGRVSLLEAFRYAQRQVLAEYESRQQVPTEHAQLDDDGDGRGSREPARDAADGPLADRFHLAAGAGTGPWSPQREELELQARAILEQLAALRQLRAAMKPQVYEGNLEALLVGLALNRRALRETAP